MIKVKRDADSYILTQKNNIVKVLNIAIKQNTNDIVLIGREFKVKKSFYDQPINSSVFNIYIVSELDDNYQYWYLNDVKKKVILFRHNNNNIVMPVVHSNEV